MSFPPNVPVNVLVCYSKERGTKYPHWMLMLVPQGRQRGTWYHSVGGPTQDRPYEVAIEANKRTDSHGIESTELVGTIQAKDVNKVKAAAQRTPAQQCQRNVVHLVHNLEKKGLTRPGEAKRLNGLVQMSERAQKFAEQNPIDHPSGAYVPPKPQSGVPSSSSRRGSPAHSLRTPPRQSPRPPRNNNGSHGLQSSSQGHSQSPQRAAQRMPQGKSKEEGCCIVM